MISGRPGDGQPGAAPGRRWRGLYFAAAAVAVAGIAGGIAAATIAATGSGAGSASTGSVTMSINASATHACRYRALLPGQLTGSARCTLSVTYTGSLPAHLSLTVRIRSTAGASGHLLYDGTNTTGLTLSISDGHTGFRVPTGPGRTGGSCPAHYRCWTARNELAAWYGNRGPGLEFRAGDALTVGVTPRFGDAADHAYEGATATVTLSVQAVQAPANPLPATCTVSTIGQPCPARGSFVWS
jgi:hypothetical protein